jgi:putative SOS response-associated peptidase YedK
MCYTISINLTKVALEKRFGAKTEKLRDFNPRYIVSAFSLPELPAITIEEPGEFLLLRWGLIPFWVKDEKAAAEIRTKTMNARAESIAVKPSFRNSIKSFRCLIPVQGFFEWHELNAKKYPFYIHLKNNQPFALAGIYDKWVNKETGEIIHSFSIVTTSANPLMEKIHNSRKRMPVILAQDSEREWLDLNKSITQIKGLCIPFDENEMEAHPVAKIVPSKADSEQTEKLIQPFHYPELDSFFS